MDHRAATRARAFLKARIIFNNGMSTMDCVVRDLSDGGARLQITDSVALPSRFDLYILKKDETRRASLQWRTSEEIGISFENAVGVKSDASEMAERISRLEVETADLRRLVEELRRDFRPASSEMKRAS